MSPISPSGDDGLDIETSPIGSPQKYLFPEPPRPVDKTSQFQRRRKIGTPSVARKFSPNQRRRLSSVRRPTKHSVGVQTIHIKKVNQSTQVVRSLPPLDQHHIQPISRSSCGTQTPPVNKVINKYYEMDLNSFTKFYVNCPVPEFVSHRTEKELWG